MEIYGVKRQGERSPNCVEAACSAPNHFEQEFDRVESPMADGNSLTLDEMRFGSKDRSTILNE